jgi:hypothetical protein
LVDLVIAGVVEALNAAALTSTLRELVGSASNG